jgi:hypothetical protein
MKRIHILFIFGVMFSNIIYCQDYVKVNIGNTGYYLTLEKEEDDPYQNFDEDSEYYLKNEKIIYQNHYVLHYAWNKCDNAYLGTIYFSDSSQSDFDNISIIRTFKTKILDAEYICHTYKLSQEYTNSSYPGEVFFDVKYYGEIIIKDGNKYIHIIADASYSEEYLIYSIENIFSTLTRQN